MVSSAIGNCIVDCFIVNYLSIDYSQLKRGKDVSKKIVDFMKNKNLTAQTRFFYL